MQSANSKDRAQLLDTVDRSYIMVAAHRCGYISNGVAILPENSFPAMRYSKGLDVDILETDIRMTSDGVMVLMHDSTVNRTTNGSGTVTSLTLAQIKALRLIAPGGIVTQEQVPTLEEIMIFAKANNMLVSLDKYSITTVAIRDEIMRVLIATDTVDRAMLKGYDTAAEVAVMRAAYPNQAFHYMPTLSNKTEAVMIDALTSYNPSAVELIFADDATPMLSANSLAASVTSDTHIWINSLWAGLAGNRIDAVALGGDVEASWGWLINHGATMIDTDNPAQLIPYLDSLGLHGNPIPSGASMHRYDFDDGSLQGWLNTLAGDASANPNRFAARVNQGLGGGYNSNYALMHDGNDTWNNGRDVPHDTLVVSSPAFDFDEADPSQWEIELHLLGGTGSSSAAPTNMATLPDSTTSGGFMGVALRRVSDDAYLLYDRRSTYGENGAWEALGWSSAEISAAIAGDAAGETYQIDLIDQFHGSWGWVMLDSVLLKGCVMPGVELLYEASPLKISGSRYLKIDNPLTDAPYEGDVSASSGSLFLFGEAHHGGGYLVLGLFPASNTSSGAVDFGRNSGSSGFAAFDYLDHKGASSGTARVAGSPEIVMNEGVYRIIVEIRFDSPTNGTLRGWIYDGVNGSLDEATPNVETTFNSGFSTSPDVMYVRAASGSLSSWANIRAVWAGDSATRAAAFASLDPGQTYGSWQINQTLPSQTLYKHGNHDEDTRVNLMEYYMGSDPADSNSTGKFNLLNDTGSLLAVEYSRVMNQSDVTGDLKWSTDLENWYSSGESDGLRHVEIGEIVIPDPESKTERVEASLQVTSGPVTPRIFTRIDVQ